MKMKSLLWTAFAFLFIRVDLFLFGADILPDVAGYVVLFITFSILTAREPSFNRPRLLTVPLALLQTALLMRLADNETVVFILQVSGVLLDLLAAYFAFIALGRLAAAFEQTDLRRPVDSAFVFYAFAAALPLVAVLAPELERLVFFVVICLSLYVFNLLIRCFRLILLPVPVEEEPEEDAETDTEDAEDTEDTEDAEDGETEEDGQPPMPPGGETDQ
ncbi:MAG: hypothetical protein FWG93_01750 [Oscillospiraceae bacterium]|nr:hypothetical protein [Oscillospiraceae bacterium]